MGIKIKGMSELRGQIRKLPKQMLDASAIGQHNAAQDVMAVSKPLSPYEFGELEGGAYVELPKFTPSSAVVDFGYAGPDYLVRQHEDMDYQHPGIKSKTDDPGRAAQGRDHFLSNPVNEMVGRTEATIRAAVNEFLRTGRLPSLRGAFKGKGES